MASASSDLTAEELDRLAGDAWFEASNTALRAGAPVVGRQGSKIVKTYPDGRQEILGDATSLTTIDDIKKMEVVEPGHPMPESRTHSNPKQARRTG
jgi:hypothetical protein